MESELLQLNGFSWSPFRIGETSWLIQPQISVEVLDCIHSTTDLLEKGDLEGLIDIIPAYDSITLIFDSIISDLSDKISKEYSGRGKVSASNFRIHEIKVCYELGLDWNEMEEKTQLRKEEIISIHSSQEYSLAMMGFLPGFIFLEGLDDRISVTRKETPRVKVPAGSVGIGGNQTGIYSLESPGGWQIIGRTGESFFDVTKKPPTKLKPGDKTRFKPISKDEFDKIVSKNG